MERWNQSALHRGVHLATAIVAVGVMLGVGAHSRAAIAACTGDCNGDGTVTVDEGITVAAINLGDQATAACPSLAGSAVDITTVVAAANNEANGCAVVGPPVCGDGVVEPPEDCDIGGVCIGNAKAGTACTTNNEAADCCSNSSCTGANDGGVCLAGDKAGAACTQNSDCPSSTCVRCKVYEGKIPDTNSFCAANCTFESSLVFNLKPGEPDPNTLIAPGTSGAVVHGEVLSLPLPIGNGCLGGSKAGQPCTMASDCPQGVCAPATQTFGVGKVSADGSIPLVIKAASVFFPQIDVGGLACACVRGVSQKSCGGTAFEADGTTETPFCTDNFGVCDPTTHTCGQATTPKVSCTQNSDCEGDTFCTAAGRNPCAFVHGDGNSASGFAGCSAAGLAAPNYDFSQDAGGCSNPPACTERTPLPPVIVFHGPAGAAGSALLLNTTAIGTAIGSCSGTDQSVYGPDGEICTADDPQASRGTPQTIPLTTGKATSIVFHANFSQSGITDVTICDTGPGGDQCIPYATEGAPFSCDALVSGAAPGGGLVSAFVSLDQPTIMDIAVVSQFYAE
jgi:hypothetical protein